MKDKNREELTRRLPSVKLLSAAGLNKRYLIYKLAGVILFPVFIF